MRNDWCKYPLLNNDHQYRFCDLILSSNLELPELLRAEGAHAGIHVKVEPEEESGIPTEPCYRRWTLPDGKLWATFHRCENGDIRAHFPWLAQFMISRDGRHIHCRKFPAVSDDTLRHLLLDQILPSIQSTQRTFVLHASVIATPYGAIAFAGASGHGKSTMAATFAANGFPLLSDDSLLLEERAESVYAIPSYPGLRLWKDAVTSLFDNTTPLSQVAQYTSKKRLACDGSRLEFCNEPIPLRRIFFLAADHVEDHSICNAVKITPLSAREAFMQVMAHAFRLQTVDRDRMRHEFNALARLSVRRLFHRLAFRRDFALLPQVREAILSSLSDQALVENPTPISHA